MATSSESYRDGVAAVEPFNWRKFLIPRSHDLPMASEKLSEGDTVTMTGEVTRVNDDGTVTVRLHRHGRRDICDDHLLGAVARWVCRRR